MTSGDHAATRNCIDEGSHVPKSISDGSFDEDVRAINVEAGDPVGSESNECIAIWPNNTGQFSCKPIRIAYILREHRSADVVL